MEPKFLDLPASEGAPPWINTETIMPAGTEVHCRVREEMAFVKLGHAFTLGEALGLLEQTCGVTRQNLQRVLGLTGEESDRSLRIDAEYSQLG